jgi:hypothetical protein
MVENAAEDNIYDAWLKSALGFDPAEHAKPKAPPAAAGQGASPQAASLQAASSQPASAVAVPGTAGAVAGAPPGGEKKGETALGHQTNPFDAPEVRMDIEKIALPKLQQLTVQQTQNARADFLSAIDNVRKEKKAQAAEEEEKKEFLMTVVLTVALLPAGPIVEAAAAGINGQSLINHLGDIIADAAPTLEKKFGAAGAKAADKAFKVVASDQIGKLAESFDEAKAKAALEAGVDKLKDKSVKFAANSDKKKAIDSYLDALVQSANDSMHNLTDVILNTDSFSAAVGYYNLFHMKLQSSYQAAVAQQVDDMLSELNDAIVDHGEEQVLSVSEDGGGSYGMDEIATIKYGSRLMYAHVTRITVTGAFLSGKPSYGFVKWVTPDMLESAVKMVRDHLTMDDFKNTHIPDPVLEPGERVIQVKDGNRERLMLITVEDKHGFFSNDFGVCTFKQWASEDDEAPFRARGVLQNGGINEMKLGDIKDVPRA